MESLVVLNLDGARYDCTYGRGCDGVCCREGRPPVIAEDARRIDAHLERFLPLLRVEARAVIRRDGFLTRGRPGPRRLRRAAGWCVFFHDGCVLHKVGAGEGDRFKYKPALCSLFPISINEQGRWYLREKGYDGEAWDLLCLDAARVAKPATVALRDELALAESLHGAAAAPTACRDTASLHTGKEGSCHGC